MLLILLLSILMICMFARTVCIKASLTNATNSLTILFQPVRLLSLLKSVIPLLSILFYDNIGMHQPQLAQAYMRVRKFTIDCGQFVFCPFCIDSA